MPSLQRTLLHDKVRGHERQIDGRVVLGTLLIESGLCIVSDRETVFVDQALEETCAGGGRRAEARARHRDKADRADAEGVSFPTTQF
jgi:hypothetical protein